jgi:hypothetical protein
MKTILFVFSLIICFNVAFSQSPIKGDSVNNIINSKLKQPHSSKSVSDSNNTKVYAHLKETREVCIIDIFGITTLGRQMFYYSDGGNLIKLILFTPEEGKDEMNKTQYYFNKGQVIHIDGFKISEKEIDAWKSQASKEYLIAMKNI